MMAMQVEVTGSFAAILGRTTRDNLTLLLLMAWELEVEDSRVDWLLPT